MEYTVPWESRWTCRNTHNAIPVIHSVCVCVCKYELILARGFRRAIVYDFTLLKVYSIVFLFFIYCLLYFLFFSVLVLFIFSLFVSMMWAQCICSSPASSFFFKKNMKWSAALCGTVKENIGNAIICSSMTTPDEDHLTWNKDVARWLIVSQNTEYCSS